MPASLGRGSTRTGQRRRSGARAALGAVGQGETRAVPAHRSAGSDCGLRSCHRPAKSLPSRGAPRAAGPPPGRPWEPGARRQPRRADQARKFGLSALGTSRQRKKARRSRCEEKSPEARRRETQRCRAHRGRAATWPAGDFHSIPLGRHAFRRWRCRFGAHDAHGIAARLAPTQRAKFVASRPSRLVPQPAS